MPRWLLIVCTMWHQKLITTVSSNRFTSTKHCCDKKKSSAMCKVQKEKESKLKNPSSSPVWSPARPLLLNSNLTLFVLQPLQCMNSVCLLVQRILLMWVEGEGDGRRWSTKSSQGGSAGKQSHSPRGLNCVIDFSHLPHVCVHPQ